MAHQIRVGPSRRRFIPRAERGKGRRSGNSTSDAVAHAKLDGTGVDQSWIPAVPGGPDRASCATSLRRLSGACVGAVLFLVLLLLIASPASADPAPVLNSVTLNPPAAPGDGYTLSFKWTSSIDGPAACAAGWGRPWIAGSQDPTLSSDPAVPGRLANIQASDGGPNNPTIACGDTSNTT